MFSFFGFLFIIIIAILLIGLSIVGTVIRTIFGLGGRRSTDTNANGRGNYQSGRGYSFNDNQQPDTSHNEETTYEERAPHPKRKKLFSKDEGEYVDFEEIKE